MASIDILAGIIASDGHLARDRSTIFVKYNIPSGSKSASIEPPDLQILSKEIDYFKGWVAGDGSVTNDRGRPKIEIWSKSQKMMLWFRQILSEAKIESQIFVDKKRDKHILRIGKKRSIMEFYQKIEIPHPAKKRKLLELLNKMSWLPSN